MKPNRKRYVLFTIHQDGPSFSDKQLAATIWSNLLSLYGEIGIADCKLYINEYDEKTGIGYLQCNASKLEFVITAASLIKTVNDTKISFQPTKTSGTIKALGR